MLLGQGEVGVRPEGCMWWGCWVPLLNDAFLTFITPGMTQRGTVTKPCSEGAVWWVQR